MLRKKKIFQQNFFFPIGVMTYTSGDPIWDGSRFVKIFENYMDWIGSARTGLIQSVTIYPLIHYTIGASDWCRRASGKSVVWIIYRCVRVSSTIVRLHTHKHAHIHTHIHPHTTYTVTARVGEEFGSATPRG